MAKKKRGKTPREKRRARREILESLEGRVLLLSDQVDQVKRRTDRIPPSDEATDVVLTLIERRVEKIDRRLSAGWVLLVLLIVGGLAVAFLVWEAMVQSSRLDDTLDATARLEQRLDALEADRPDLEAMAKVLVASREEIALSRATLGRTVERLVRLERELGSLPEAIPALKEGLAVLREAGASLGEGIEALETRVAEESRSASRLEAGVRDAIKTWESRLGKETEATLQLATRLEAIEQRIGSLMARGDDDLAANGERFGQLEKTLAELGDVIDDLVLDLAEVKRSLAEEKEEREEPERRRELQ